MDTFKAYMLRKAYERYQKLGDRLAKIEHLIDWEAFRPIIQGLYHNQGPPGGRPNMDEVVMVKLLVLQQWYGLSDPELERQVADRMSFQGFLGFPEILPDYSTVWQLRERLAESGRDRLVWEELQRQLDVKGLRVRKGVVQDATFITADPGKHGKPRGEEAKTRRSRDGSWTKKGSRSYYGYKLHAKTDVDLDLIRDLETTAASVHDSRVDLSLPGEVAYMDKTYFGVDIRGYSAAMRRRDPGSSAEDTGQAAEQAYQQEEGSRGEALRVDQEGFQRGACVGDYCAAGQGEDGFRVFLLQLGSAGLVGGGLTA